MATEVSDAERDACTWAHLYPQFTWHGNAYLIGTPSALRAVRDAIDAALSGGDGAVAELFASDGEGYHLMIGAVTFKELDALTMPYSDRLARGSRAMSPAHLPIITKAGRDWTAKQGQPP